jgi:glycosyltransferase involved in cell wall biosynthesis
MASEKRASVAVIVPAYNEQDRIGDVLRAVCGARLPDEIIVVSDGSTDRTVEVAKRYKGVNVVDLKKNVGKGGAMSAGVKATKADIIAFVDADLSALQPEHIDKIIAPIIANQCEVCIGVFRGGKVWSDAAQRVAPYLSGQRAMRRSFFESIPYLDELRMGVEYQLNTHMRRRKMRVLRVVLRGVSNCHKERKLGLAKGLQARYQMWKEITNAAVRVRRRRKGDPWPRKGRSQR